MLRRGDYGFVIRLAGQDRPQLEASRLAAVRQCVPAARLQDE